jgi:hypothetical protein
MSAVQGTCNRPRRGSPEDVKEAWDVHHKGLVKALLQGRFNDQRCRLSFCNAAHYQKITGTQAAAGHCLADWAQGLLSEQGEMHRILPGNTSPPVPSSVSLQAFDIILFQDSHSQPLLVEVDE